jgi:hypothetical protein
VLGSDRFLVDFLSDVELEAIRAMWARLRHPDECRLLAQRRSDLRYLENATTIARSWQRQTHLPSVAAVDVAGNVRGTPGPVPLDRGRETGIGGIARRAQVFR